jgi:hypothetical protein
VEGDSPPGPPDRKTAVPFGCVEVRVFTDELCAETGDKNRTRGRINARINA